MAPRFTWLKYAVVGSLGCLLGFGISAWLFSKAATEELIGRTAIAALNDLSHIAMIENNNHAKAKHYMELLVVQDLRFLSSHSKDKGESGRLSTEALRRAVNWRDQHPNLNLAPDLQTELKALNP